MTQTILVQLRYKFNSCRRNRSLFEESFAVYLVGLESCYRLCATSNKQGHQIWKILLSTGQTKANKIRQWPDLANRWDVVFPNDNIRPHAFLAIINTLLEFDWNAMPYPLCSPDIAPSDYCNFIFYQNFSLLPPPPKKTLFEWHEKSLRQVFCQQTKKFWKENIIWETKKWKKVVKQKCAHILFFAIFNICHFFKKKFWSQPNI